MKLFIAYSRVDREICKQLATNILTAHEIWYDYHILGGEDWWNRIVEQIELSDGLIFLMSNESVDSKHCQKEVEIAQKLGKKIIPIQIRARTKIPKHLKNLHYIVFENGMPDVSGVTSLLNTLLDNERQILNNHVNNLDGALSQKDFIPPRVNDSSKIPVTNRSLSYNYWLRLNQSELVDTSKVAYMKWLCLFIEWITNQKIDYQDRENYLSKIPQDLLLESLTVSQIRSWLHNLLAEGYSSAQQPRSMLTNLLNLLFEDRLIDGNLIYKIRNIDITPITQSNYNERILDESTLFNLLNNFELNRPGDIRDAVILSMCCVLRSGELSKAKWTNIKITEGSVRYISKDSKTIITLPTVAQEYIIQWRDFLISENYFVNNDAFVLKRMNSRHRKTFIDTGITTRAILTVVSTNGEKYGLEKITPDILRMSFKNIKKNIDASDVL